MTDDPRNLDKLISEVLDRHRDNQFFNPWSSPTVDTENSRQSHYTPRVPLYVRVRAICGMRGGKTSQTSCWGRNATERRTGRLWRLGEWVLWTQNQVTRQRRLR
ncbi:hypothetical protein LCGC14_1156050 [marine sediment metagenome]|uniref:Uncharacterized protein n=1 Tax=marine sediment metagenome TaxID=412755 RepID=A0A0F9PZJ6_9ZZZZ